MINISKPAVAIFGGSFDPPHKGHQEIVEKATKVLDIDKVLVVPAYLNPFKTSSLASAKQRLEWSHTLFDNMKNVIVDDYEIREGKSTTTYKSVKHFKTKYNVKYLIIGSDNLSTLTKWHQFEWLNKYLTWAVVTREGYTLDLSSLNNYVVIQLDANVSSTNIRENKDLYSVDKKIKKSVKDILEGS
ncbi:Nicotinate-nucleotide adenylyltransferase [hydrothermal vent metagenome]|uniref:Nicotinate-nucleotide adenylyltransferase n=1 Tax=hydrothermal vent metagenome TaxID=652676 RepID=A0A1W1EBQ9_9ZZZZ